MRQSTAVSILAFCSLIRIIQPVVAGATESDTTADAEVVIRSAITEEAGLGTENSTGSRLGLSALDTPASITTISAQSIQLRGDSNMVDAVSHATGIAAMPSTGSGGYGFAVRGFGSSSVTILYDGIKSLINTGSMTYPYDTWNVDRIEVLNGAASVLYGGGAVGAAVNVVPRTPSPEFENSIRLAGGSFGTYRAAFDSTGPINDKVFYRLDGSYNTSDGYVNLGHSSASALTAALSYQATDTLRFTLSEDLASRKAFDYLGLPLVNGSVQRSLRDVNYASADSRIPFEDQRVTWSVNWQPSADMTLRDVAYYIYGTRLWRYPSQFVYRSDLDRIQRGGFGTFQQYQHQYGDHGEITWNTAVAGHENTVSAGFDVDHLENQRYVNSYTGTDLLDLYNSQPGFFPNSTVTRNWQNTSVHQYALFAEDRFVALPALSVVSGIRLDHQAVDRTDLVATTHARATYKPVSWRGGLVYELASRFNAYAQYSTAVDPVANLCCISASQLAFSMSKGRQIEAGLKQVLASGRIEWSAAAYKIIKNNLLTPDPTNIALSVAVGQQSSRGIEAALTWHATDTVRIEANGTTLEAHYDQFSESVAGVLVSRAGRRPINIPQQLANLWATWAITPRWLAQLGAQYGGDFYADSANLQRIPGHTLLNAGLRWAVTDTVLIDLRGENLFDKFYAYTSGSNGVSGPSGGLWVLGEPRSYELALTARF